MRRQQAGGLNYRHSHQGEPAGQTAAGASQQEREGTMKVSLEGMTKEAQRVLEHAGAGVYAAALGELTSHVKKLVAGSLTMEDFAKHYCLDKKRAGKALAVRDEIDEAFDEWKAIYKPLGYRHDWATAAKKFRDLIKRQKVPAADIIAGTRGYAATGPEPQYVPLASGFLHRRKFEYDWSRANGGPPRGGPNLHDIEAHFAGRIADRSGNGERDGS